MHSARAPHATNASDGAARPAAQHRAALAPGVPETVLIPILNFGGVVAGGLCLLGGWAGGAWPWILAILTIQTAGNLWYGHAIAPRRILLAHRYTIGPWNWLCAGVIVLLAGGYPTPFWLAFVFCVVAPGFDRDRVAVNLAVLFAAIAMMAPHIAGHLSLADVTGIGAHLLVLLVVGHGSDRVIGMLDSERREHQNARAETIEALEARTRDLETMAFLDPLTGLGNRRLLEEAAAKAMARVDRDGGVVGLLYLDLVRFKRINEARGHSAGDRSLCEVAARLLGHTRATDTVVRLGGDEFAVLLVGVRNVRDCEIAARALGNAIGAPILVDEERYRIEARFGLALYPVHSRSFDELVTLADLAMERAGSPAGLGVADTSVLRDHQAALHIEDALRTALEDDTGLLLHFQPVHDVSTRRIVGMEALVRWRQPDGTLLSPAVFIPVAERTGIIGTLDRWVLGEALRQLRRWNDHAPEWVAVNIAPATFEEPGFVPFIAMMLRETGIPGSRLMLEITERSTMRNPERAAALLEALKAIDVRIAIDDFGQGHSSLAILREFPADVIKIDQHFVRGLGRDAVDEWIVAGIIGLAKGLDLVLVAEGVERAEQYHWLTTHGCMLAQGYYLGRPAPPEQITSLLTGRDDHAPTPVPDPESDATPATVGAIPRERSLCTSAAIPGSMFAPWRQAAGASGNGNAPWQDFTPP